MSGAIWAVAQLRDGKLQKLSLEAITAAQALARRTGGPVHAVVLAEDVAAAAEELSRLALAGVLTVASPACARYTPGVWSSVLAQLASERRPDWILLPHSYQSVDFAPRLAHALDAAWIPEAVTLAGEGAEIEWRRPVLGGRFHARVRSRGSSSTVVTLQAGAFPAADVEAGAATVEPVSIDVTTFDPQREILGYEEVAGEQVDLSQASVVVGVGRGIGGTEQLAPVEELARVLGAEIGASRPVIDSGWLPRDRQIGSSGQTVAPRLYLALGISGAIQHLVGMKGARVVVAVNKDADAPIFKLAQYGVVGDLHEFVPAFTEALREAGQG